MGVNLYEHWAVEVKLSGNTVADYIVDFTGRAGAVYMRVVDTATAREITVPLGLLAQGAVYRAFMQASADAAR